MLTRKNETPKKNPGRVAVFIPSDALLELVTGQSVIAPHQIPPTARVVGTWADHLADGIDLILMDDSFAPVEPGICAPRIHLTFCKR